MSELRCMVVTPERTELDVTTKSVTVPLFDGELGILPGHSPMVGRLGFGVLRIAEAGSNKEYFIEGGFVQVSGETVSVLTDRLVSRSEIKSSDANTALTEAQNMPADKPDSQAARDKALARARAMVRVTS